MERKIFYNIKSRKIQKWRVRFQAFILGIVPASVASVEGMEKLDPKGETISSFQALISDEDGKILVHEGEKFAKKIYEDSLNLEDPECTQGVRLLLKPYTEKVQYAPLITSWMPSMYVRKYFSSTDQAYIHKRLVYQDVIISLTWYFHSLAQQQGEGFERGSFTIIDPHYKISNFLLDYVKLVTGYTELEINARLPTLSNYAYQRSPEWKGSSHHRKFIPYAQFGIDIRQTPDTTVLMFLPYKHTHILCGKLVLDDQHHENLLFFKTEPMGTGNVGAMLVHGLHFLSGKVLVKEGARRESDAPQEILEAYKTMLEETGEPPLETPIIRQMYLQAQKCAALYNPALENNDDMLEELLPADMLKSGGHIEALLAPPLSQNIITYQKYKSAQRFLSVIDTYYKNGFNHLRVGNEVIIQLKGTPRGETT